MTENRVEDETAKDEDGGGEAEKETEKEAEAEKERRQREEREVREYAAELAARLRAKEELRLLNRGCVRPPDSHFSKLDSGLKKNTTFVKKLKVFSAQQLDSLVRDCAALNLSKYVSEVAAALVDAKLKMSDVPAAVSFCSMLHRAYADFSQSLFECWQKSLAPRAAGKEDKGVAAAPAQPQSQPQTPNNPSKLRVDLRFYAELVSCGVFAHKGALSLLGGLLTALINSDREDHNNLTILLTFCKHCGDEYAGLAPKRILALAKEYDVEIPRSAFLPPEKQAGLRGILREYFSSVVRHLGVLREQLHATHAANRRTLHTRGELSRDRKDQLEALQANYDRLLSGAQNLADILNEEVGEAGEPITGMVGSVTDAATGEIVSVSFESDNKLSSNDPWQDEDTRSFYTSLPDMKLFMPNYQPQKEETLEIISEEILDEELRDEEFNDTEEPVVPEPEQDDAQTVNISNKFALETFLNQMPNCINREMIDNSAVEFFLNLNTKHNRKKVTRILFSVPRTRLDLLPFYARFTAILHPVLPDIATDLCQMLKHDFKYHVRKKDQINIESKIKVVRFIGELVKFNLYSKIEALYCLKVLLHDFKHHHIEMFCNLLETCGRFLYCLPDTHQRMAIYLQQMMRIKCVSVMDSRHITQIENAYYYVNPPESASIAREDEPPLHQFIQKMLHQDIQKSNEDKIVRLIRKIDWDSEELSTTAVQWLAAGWKVKHAGRRCLARLVAALAAWQEVIGSQVVDAVLEDLRITMEHPQPRHNQRRIAMTRYLGELYNYKLVDSRDIFNALYSFITFGVSLDHSAESSLDPPDSVFRIRLVCVLLETCGSYFNSGSSKKKLDYFLIFFQNYYWYKFSHPHWTEENPFPIDVKNLYLECLTILRPKLVHFDGWQMCKDAIDEMKNSLYPNLDDEDGNDQAIGNISDGDGLETIMETDDEGNSDHPDVSNSSDEELELTENEETNTTEIQDTPRLPSQKQVEDLEFESAFEKMLLDNMSERQRESRIAQRDFSVPVSCRQQTKKTYEQILQGSDNVEFVLMVRKGTKQQYKAFDAPSELTINLKQQAHADRLEMERVKRLTLNISERQEEEEYCGEGGSGGGGGGGGGISNPNRGQYSRHKYQHPKGAPDVDLIFGTKKLK